MVTVEKQTAEKCVDLGNQYIEQDNFDLAIEEFTQAIQLNPNYTEAYFNRGKCYGKQGSYESALKDFDKAIQLDPDYTQAYYKRGYCYYEEKNYESALKDFDKAIQLDPDYTQAYYKRGYCYYEEKNYESALKDFDKAIQSDPDDCNFYRIRAICYENTKYYEFALKDYEKAFQLFSKSEVDDDDDYDYYLYGCYYKGLCNSIVLAAIKVGQYEKARDYRDKGKRFLIGGSDDDDDDVNFEKLIERSEEKEKQLKSEIKEHEKEKEALLHEKEKEMLSFFTHTMRNALATAPESLRQAIHLLGSDLYEKDTKHYQAINKIASLFSTLSLTDCLIDTFKLSISDPQEFKQSWQKDHSGEATPKWAIASALRQVLNRMIFMSDTSELRKLLDNPETVLIKTTRKSFIEEVLPLNVDSQGVDVFYVWTLKHISAIDMSIADCDTLNFGVNQIRFSLLFAITSELILNALKYWDGENRIQISWQLAEQNNYVFSVKNHCKANATSNLAGSHKGLAFIKRLVELLGERARFVCKSEDQLFTAELILNKALFDGES